MDASTNISPEEGYCQAEKSSSDNNKDIFTFYYYQDYLGNIRQVREANGSKGYVIQTMNYYPFGAEFCDGSTKNNTQKHKYNGKEFDNMHGLNSYDYGARQYNPVTARWDRIDPLCEKYYSTSPYAYCMNNPVICFDPDGREIFMSPKDPEAQAIILQFINELTGGNGMYAFNENGLLERTDVDLNKANVDYTDNENGRLIDEAIMDKKNMIHMFLGDDIPNGHGSRDLLGEHCGGGVSPAYELGNGKKKYFLGLDPGYTMRANHIKDVKGVGFGENEWTMFDTFIHELYGHAIPKMKNIKGDAITFENQVRHRLGKRERKLELKEDGTTTNHPTF